MISLVIQAGGQSRRMGEDKGLKLFFSRPLIQWVVDRLRGIADEVLVSTNDPEKYTFLGIPLVADLFPGVGPLGGLYTALDSASSANVAIVACDMPFASAALLECSAKMLMKKDVDIVIPRTSAGLEPFHAVYRRDICLPVIRSVIESNKLKVTDWFHKVRVRELTPEEVAAVDPSGLTFWNLNTIEEFNRAENLWRDMNKS
jgi:molybdopterin-guanine dinucleotide biosynthesis protein A